MESIMNDYWLKKWEVEMNCYTAQIIKRPTESPSPINCTMLVGLTVRVRNKLTTHSKMI